MAETADSRQDHLSPVPVLSQLRRRNQKTDFSFRLPSKAGGFFFPCRMLKRPSEIFRRPASNCPGFRFLAPDQFVGSLNERPIPHIGVFRSQFLHHPMQQGYIVRSTGKNIHFMVKTM